MVVLRLESAEHDAARGENVSREFEGPPLSQARVEWSCCRVEVQFNTAVGRFRSDGLCTDSRGYSTQGMYLGTSRRRFRYLGTSKVPYLALIPRPIMSSRIFVGFLDEAHKPHVYRWSLFNDCPPSLLTSLFSVYILHCPLRLYPRLYYEARHYAPTAPSSVFDL